MRRFGWGRRRRPAVLVYHRVRDTIVDPFGMSVAPARFADHLRVLRSSRRPLLALADLAARHLDGTVPDGAIAITVDDGYADGADAARALAEHDVPATFFVSTAAVGAVGMWWDHVVDSLLSTCAIEPFEIAVGGQRYPVEPGPPVDPATHADWRISMKPHPTARHAAVHRLWMLLLCATADERAAGVEALDAATADATPRRRAMLDGTAIAALEATAPVRVGSHTVSHLSLVRVGHRERASEFAIARDELAELVGHEIDAVAYPHGHLDGDITAAAQRAGHTVGVARGNVSVAADATVMRLPRIEIGDWTGADFERRLATWG